MTETRGVDQHPRNEEFVSIVEIASAVVRHWRAVLVLPVAFALGVSVWTVGRDRAYVVSSSFVPQSSEMRGSGGVSGLAMQLGVQLGTDRPGQSPHFYVNLLRSRAVLRAVVEAEYEVPGEEGNVKRATLLEFMNAANRSGRRPPWRWAVDELRRNLVVTLVPETGEVRFTVTASHPVLAEQVAEKLLQILNDFSTEIRQARAHEEGRFISGRVAQAWAELLSAEEELKAFLRQNRHFQNSSDLAFEHDRLQRRVAMRQEVYTSLVRSQDETRIEAMRDTPLFAVIDHPSGTAEPKGRGLIMRILLAAILGSALALGIAIIRDSNRRSRERGDPRFREFQGVVRQAWGDLRHPRRWVQRDRETAATGRDR
jgi:uncharacterized protein involved in exopolysaccharide biosynthesis